MSLEEEVSCEREGGREKEKRVRGRKGGREVEREMGKSSTSL